MANIAYNTQRNLLLAVTAFAIATVVPFVGKAIAGLANYSVMGSVTVGQAAALVGAWTLWRVYKRDL